MRIRIGFDLYHVNNKELEFAIQIEMMLRQRICIYDFVQAFYNVVFCNRYWVIVQMSSIRHYYICRFIQWLFKLQGLKL